MKFKHSNSFSTYSITFTCVEWVSLLDISSAYNMVYKWFVVLKKEYHADVFSQVIMPNHL